MVIIENFLIQIFRCEKCKRSTLTPKINNSFTIGFKVLENLQKLIWLKKNFFEGYFKFADFWWVFCLKWTFWADLFAIF
jgi:hypothetical protein